MGIISEYGVGGKWSVSVIYPKEAITRGFLNGSACPNFAHDLRLPEILIYGEINEWLKSYSRVVRAKFVMYYLCPKLRVHPAPEVHDLTLGCMDF